MADSSEFVMVHDAARPFIDHAVIDRVLDALDDAPGAIPALPVADTVAFAERFNLNGNAQSCALIRRRRWFLPFW